MVSDFLSTCWKESEPSIHNFSEKIQARLTLIPESFLLTPQLNAIFSLRIEGAWDSGWGFYRDANYKALPRRSTIERNKVKKAHPRKIASQKAAYQAA